MLYTLQNAIDFTARHVQRAKESPTVIARINEAERRLVVKGNWLNTIRRLRFCTQNDSVTLPRGVARVLQVNICGSPRRAFPMNYEFLECGPGEILRCTDVSSPDLVDMGGHHPSLFDPPYSTPMKLMAASSSPDDRGKTITLYGLDATNTEIRSGTAPGETINVGVFAGGVDGKLDDADFPQLTTNLFRQLEAVRKPITKGHVTLMAYDGSTRNIWFLAKYHPHETQPTYRRYKIIGRSLPSVAPDDDYLMDVELLVKLDHVDLVHPDDMLVIQSLDAIKTMIQAITREDEGDLPNSQQFEAQAIRLLNDQLKGHRQHPGMMNVEVQQEGIGIGAYDVP